MEQNDFNLIEKCLRAACDPHIAFIQTTLTGCGSFCLESRVTTNCESFLRQERYYRFIFYVQRTLLVEYGVATLQPSDQIPCSVDSGLKYFKDKRFAVDWY